MHTTLLVVLEGRAINRRYIDLMICTCMYELLRTNAEGKSPSPHASALLRTQPAPSRFPRGNLQFAVEAAGAGGGAGWEGGGLTAGSRAYADYIVFLDRGPPGVDRKK